MRQFEVECIRSGDWWAIEVPDVPGVHTQARRLDQVKAMAKDAIALMLDVSEDDIEVEIRSTRLTATGESVIEKDLGSLLWERQELAELQAKFASHIRSIAVQLVHDQGLTVRDAGALMGISYQRVAQLLGPDQPRPR